MHYYSFNISSYLSHTQHLDNLEDLAYRRMLDYCYLHEEPLPLDVTKISKLIRMRDECERIADVLREFFVEEKDGYHHPKVNDEILKYRTKSEKAKQSAKARWDKKSLKKKALRKDANALQTDSEGNAKQELRTNKQEPLYIIPGGINLDAWKEWETYRKEKKKPISKHAATKQFKLLLEYSKETQKEILDNSIQNDYQGLFKPKGVTNEKNSANEPRPDNSVAGRVAENARKARENNQAMGVNDGDLWTEMDERERGANRSNENMGSVFEGDFRRTD